MPGVFEGLPCALEEMTMLRIENGGILRAEAEEAGVEQVHAGERASSLDVVGVCQRFRGYTRVPQLPISKRLDGFSAGPQVSPKFRQITRAGKAPSHSDDS